MDNDKNIEMALDQGLRFKAALVSKPYPQLRKILSGINKGDLDSYRFAKTWQEQRIAPRWVPTIGLWGGVGSVQEVLDRAGTDYNNMRAFKNRHGCTTNGRKASVEQARLAYFVYGLVVTRCGFDPNPTHEDISSICGELGILGIEANEYTSRMHTLLTQDLNVENPLLIDVADIQKRWDELYYLRPLPEHSLYSAL